MKRGSGDSGRTANMLLAHVAPVEGLAHDHRAQEFLKGVPKQSNQKIILRCEVGRLDEVFRRM